MKTVKSLLILLLLTLTICTAVSAKDVSFRRLQIEENYAARMKQLYATAEREASKLNVTDRLLWVEFITGAETPYSDSFSLYTIGGGSGSLAFATYTDPYENGTTGSILLASATESYAHKLSTLTRPQRYLQAYLADSYSLTQFTTFLLSDQSSEVFSSIASSRFHNRRFRNQARRLLKTAERLHIEARQIVSERNAALAAMRRAEEYAKRTVPAPVQQAQPQDVETGVVTAISYSAKSSICMVEGVDEVLSPGDVIDTDDIKGVKVESIGRNSVQFSRKGKAWTQTLGETANSRMID